MAAQEGEGSKGEGGRTLKGSTCSPTAKKASTLSRPSSTSSSHTLKPARNSSRGELIQGKAAGGLDSIFKFLIFDIKLKSEFKNARHKKVIRISIFRRYW
jgi:hypothetical protein